MSNTERFDRLDAAVSIGRVLRCAWADGQGRACLLATLAPEVVHSDHDGGYDGVISDCPASVIAPWLAEMTPDLDDAGSAREWPGFVRRYAATVRRCAVLTSGDWRRADFSVRAGILRLALPNAGSAAGAVEAVIVLCERAAGGDVAADAEWRDARAAASSMVRGMEAAAAAAARAATYPDDSEAATGAAKYAARAISWDVESARDQIGSLTLDVLNAACAAREAET